MATMVLVPGYWLGAWAWERVLPPLRAAGHDVYPVTLTGVGERAAEGGPEVDLERHINDIIDLIVTNDLHDVVLIGHSGGGIPVTGAADRIPDRIARVVYVDAGPLPDGMSQLDVTPPETREAIEKQVASTGDGWRYEMPAWDMLDPDGSSRVGLSEDDLRMLRERATAQPILTAAQSLQLSNPDSDALPKTAICATFPLEQVQAMIDSGHPFFAKMSGPEWELIALPTGHWPMFSRPDDLAEVLNRSV